MKYRTLKGIACMMIIACLCLPEMAAASAFRLNSLADNTVVTTLKASVNYNKMTKKVKKKKKIVKREYRSLANQKMYGYDTFQGAASDGTYAYHVLTNKSKNKSKIVKVKNSTGKVVKVSKALKIGHANDATYDYFRNELVTTYKNGETRYLAIINPKTLKLKRYQEIGIPEKIPGMSKKATAAIKGLAAIAYDESTGQFIGRMKGKRSFILLDADYNAVEYIKIEKWQDYLCQTIECTDKVILHAQSPQKAGQCYNIISVYDYEGNYLATIKAAKSGREIESIYRAGSKLYAGEYYSHYVTKTKKVKKKVKVRDKNGKVVRKKNGKIKYKYKKVKVKYKKFIRDNHIYRLGI